MVKQLFGRNGFTLIELLMVIVISGILAVGVTTFIAQTSDTLVSTSQRLNLATTANVISERISREIRSALPNSVRIFDDGGNSCLELVPTINSSEYLSVPLASPANSFQIIPLLSGANRGYVSVYPSSSNAVYNTSSNTVTQVQANIAAAPAPAQAGVQQVTFDGAASVQFPTDSPSRRFYLTTQPVAFCEDSNGFVWRYFDYGFHNNSRSSLPPPANQRQVIGNSLLPGSLAFELTPAQLQRNAVVRVSMVISSPRNESVAIAQEVQLRNVP